MLMVLEYFFQKLMDHLLNIIKNKNRILRLKKAIDAFEYAQHKDILPLIKVHPYFISQNTKIVDRHEKTMYIAFPQDLRKSINEKETGKFSNIDAFFTPLSIPGISDKQIQEALETARVSVAKQFVHRDDGLFFNGMKYGLLYADGFSRTVDASESPILHIEVFKTDHYTSHVISETLNLLDIDKSLITYDSLNSNLNWFRTSLGLSIIVILKSTNEIILTHRSTSASYSEGKNWIYVSSTETLTETDIDSYKQDIDLLLCLERGILEELGIQREMYMENSVKFYDSFFETHFLQDGIVASIELEDSYSFEDIRKLPAKDKQLEIKDMFVIPNTKKAIANFIMANKTEMRAQTVFALESYASRL